jgi:hypothetical protein
MADRLVVPKMLVKQKTSGGKEPDCMTNLLTKREAK